VFVPDVSGESGGNGEESTSTGGLLYGTVAALRAVDPDRVGGEAAAALRAVRALV
jgi:hypothetical protein